MAVNKILALMLVGTAFSLFGCDESECKDGTRTCEGNLSRTCVEGVWREVLCKGNAPICDTKLGCMKSNDAKCGNDIIETGEDCDGSAIHGKTCADINSALAGVLGCTAECRFDTQACVPNECNEDDRQCSGSVLQFCANKVWKDVQDCAQDGLKCDSEQKKCISE